MTPAARVQTAIEILDQVIAAARANAAPADRVFANAMRERRYAGSKDRRAVRELVFSAIRACGPTPETGRAAMLRLAEVQPEVREAFDGSQYGPPAIGEREIPAKGGIARKWVFEKLKAGGIEGAEAEALLDRAPLDVRVNTLKADRTTVELPEQGEPLVAPQGLRFASGTNVEQWTAYRDGAIEVQDCGSQLTCLAAQAAPGQTVIDLCAGAGGKTLALAAAMGNSGKLVACDTDRTRLSNLAPRAERAGAQISETILLDPGRELDSLEDLRGQADCVFVDAPCSGSGTWRRKPDARWRLTDKVLERLLETQRHILDYAAKLVKPGGALVYITCSVFDEEGSEQVTRFLAGHKDFVADPLDLPAGRPRGDGIRLTPHHDGTDGFFIARLRKL